MIVHLSEEVEDVITNVQTGAPHPDLATTNANTILDNIGQVYGESIRRELLELEIDHRELEVKGLGYISNGNFNQKRGHFIFFINGEWIRSTCHFMRHYEVGRYLQVAW